MFTIPDKGEGVDFDQSIWFQEYIDVLATGIARQDCVVSGCAVSTSANLQVSVAAGVVRSNNERLTVSSATPTHDAADGTHPRFDLVVVNSAGSVAIRKGTAASNPVPPARTANDVVLAVVYIPSGLTTLLSGHIVDLRVLNISAADASVQTVGYPAGALKPRVTNGSTAATIELSTNNTLVISQNFDPTTVQYAQGKMPAPKGLDSTVALKCRFKWSHPTTATNFGVAWAVRAKYVRDDDAIDGAWSSWVQVNDTGGTTDDEYVSADSGNLAPAGTYGENCSIYFEIKRVADDGTNDTLAVVARLSEFVVLYTTKVLSDA